MRASSPTRKTARHANPQQRRAHRTQLDALARSNLLDIARYLRFHKSTLPDNVEGEQFLRAVLQKGMPATQAPDVAPWSEGRLDSFIREANAERRKPGPKRLGEMIEFTFDELKTLKWDFGISIRHVEVCDAQTWEVEDFWADEEREADRLRKLKERRRRLAGVPKTSERAALVREALGWHWISVPVLMEALAGALRNQRNRPLKPHALRIAVKRAISELVACGLAESKIDVGEHGKATQFARYADIGSMRIDTFTRVNVNRKASDHVETQ